MSNSEKRNKDKAEINEPKIIVWLIYSSLFFMCKKKFLNQSGQIWGKKENMTTERNQFFIW